MSTIIEELSRIQRNLKAPKNLYNKFGNYSYRNAEGILEAVKPLLPDGYIILLSDEVVNVGNRYYVKATAVFSNGDDRISVSAYAREDESKKGMDGAQITGACSSYARKYALNGLLDIDDTKDSDDESLSPKNPKNMESKILENAVPAGPEFTRPDVKTADVTKVEQIPEVNPVTQYLLAQMGALRVARKISAKENNELFAKQHKALIEAGLAPDKKLDEYTMEEAEALIDAMSKCFHLTGTELKTK